MLKAFILFLLFNICLAKPEYLIVNKYALLVNKNCDQLLYVDVTGDDWNNTINTLKTKLDDHDLVLNNSMINHYNGYINKFTTSEFSCVLQHTYGNNHKTLALKEVGLILVTLYCAVVGVYSLVLYVIGLAVLVFYRIIKPKTD